MSWEVSLLTSKYSLPQTVCFTKGLPALGMMSHGLYVNSAQVACIIVMSEPTARLLQGPSRDADGNENDAQPSKQPEPRTSMNELFGSDDDE